MRHDLIHAFELRYANRTFFCEALMRDRSYLIYFNSRYKVEIAHDFEYDWHVTAGTILPTDIVYSIGHNIESRYI